MLVADALLRYRSAERPVVSTGRAPRDSRWTAGQTPFRHGSERSAGSPDPLFTLRLLNRPAPNVQH
eukprot:7381415-Alexandrium_andersonii.AAC.1